MINKPEDILREKRRTVIAKWRVALYPTEDLLLGLLAIVDREHFDSKLEVAKAIDSDNFDDFWATLRSLLFDDVRPEPTHQGTDSSI